MYESKTIPFNNEYGDKCTKRNPKKIIMDNSSGQHVTITAIDPDLGNAVEVMVRKDQLPDWLTTKE